MSEGTNIESGSPAIETTVSMGPASPEPVVNQEFLGIIPEEYKDKPFVQSILQAENPQVELFKQFEDYQTKAQQSAETAAIPAADAPDDVWEKFYSSARPDSPDKYEIGKVELGEGKEHIAEGLNEYRTPEYLNSVKQIMHKYGLTEKQAKGLATDITALDAGIYEQGVQKALEHEQALEADWSKLLKETFGGDGERAISVGREMLSSSVPDNLKQTLAGMSNQHLMVMLATLNHVHKTKLKEDNFLGGSASGGGNPDDIRAEMRKLMSNPAYSNKFDMKHETIKKQVWDLAAKLPKQ